MALTKAKIVENLNAELGFNKRESMDVVKAFFKEISQTLANGEQVKLSGFGNFILKDRGERPARNPKTGEAAVVSARRVVRFHAGQKLRSQVETYVRARQ